jgi:hypothetical protein
LKQNQDLISTEDEDGWFVSSFSSGAGSCVEVKFATSGAILVRDSKDKRSDRPVVGMLSPAWATFLGDLTK